jgi:hypothetical protein
MLGARRRIERLSLIIVGRADAKFWDGGYVLGKPSDWDRYSGLA